MRTQQMNYFHLACERIPQGYSYIVRSKLPSLSGFRWTERICTSFVDIWDTTRTESYLYGRQLSMYIFMLHGYVDDTARMFNYSEVDAERGGSKVCSFITGSLRSSTTGAKRYILYSDECNGQNWNKMAISALSDLADNEKIYQQIDHNMLLAGHTSKPNNTDGGLVEQGRRWNVVFLRLNMGV